MPSQPKCITASTSTEAFPRSGLAGIGDIWDWGYVGGILGARKASAPLHGGKTMPLLRLALTLAILAPSLTYAAGFARSDNFLIYSPAAESAEAAQRYANAVLNEAEKFRKEFAEQWLGHELPERAGRSIIYVDFSTTEDRGLTWAKDIPARRFHNVWLTTSPDRAVGSTLHHEIAHTVLATQYPHPNRLPPWAEEGIACRFDDDVRQAGRDQQFRFWAHSGHGPNLAVLMEMPDLKSLDETAYAAATSLVSYLLTRGDERELVRFAEDGQRTGWDAALRSHYGIQSREDLQTDWQAWLSSQFNSG